MTYILLLCASFLAALVSGAAGFGGSLLLLPIVTAYVRPEISVPVLTVAQLLGNLVDCQAVDFILMRNQISMLSRGIS